ncbi:MAG: glycosyltransferase family 2 protein [Nitrospirales bacterium]|nr:glycosyltransferase family 2 protein [Nitrospirales bacterium]
MPEAAIGVIIPAYNAGPFLAETIESVRGQTLGNWECIIVDDGSTDETPFLLRSYRDPRIQSVRQDNSGERTARLRGFLLTKAPKIVFLDADDRLLPDSLARFSNFLDDHSSVGVAYGERILINTEGKAIGGRGRAFLNKHPEGDVLESILRRPFISTPSQACLRREAVPPAQWLGDRGRSGEWILLAGAACHSRFGYMGKSPLVEYRVHSGSQLRSVAGDPQGAVGIPEYEEVLDCLFSFPGLEARFGVTKLSQLRQATVATCLAIKGQEFLRRREYRAAQRYFRGALRAGSRDIRDILCWLATFSPFLLHLAEPLYGSVNPQGSHHHPNL